MDRSKLVGMFSDQPLPDLLTALDGHSDGKQLVNLIDQELARRSDLLRELQMYRNMLCSPIHKLPAEILSIIFVYYAHAGTSLHIPDWIDLMRVCRKWNHVARSTPELWSYHIISPYISRWEWRNLDRRRKYGGDAPMNVKLHLHSGNSRFLEQYQPFYWQPQSLRSLEVNGPTDLLEPLLARMAEYSHPILSKLDVHFGSYTDSQDTGETPYPHFTIPEDLLNSKSPQLRHLVVRHCTLNWDLVRNLCTLRWQLLRRSSPANISFTHTLLDVAEALLRCPRLGALETSLPIPAPDDLPEVPLPHLYEAMLFGNHVSCAQMLLAMKMPAMARLSLLAYDLHTAREFLHLALRLRRHFRRPGSEVMRSLHFESFSTHPQAAVTPPLTVTLGWKVDGPGVAFGHWDTSSILQLSTYPTSHVEIRKMIVKLLHALPVDSITHLDGRGVLTFTHRTWKMTILNLPALTSVSVRPWWSLAPLLSALEWFLRAKKRAPLQRIIVETDLLTERFNQDNRDEQLDERRAEARAVFAWLVDYAAEAMKQGVPIAVIDVTGGYNDILGDLKAEEICEHLSEGIFLDDVFVSREGSKKIKERRELKFFRRHGSDSDSDSD
ncbi:hypothetical protein PENSPDRAFT_603862 [Peniophora sp. CONT]|nr:hypothetical protein PENSPDRAFT_603862 [Peniophora sp. CONT]